MRKFNLLKFFGNNIFGKPKKPKLPCSSPTMISAQDNNTPSTPYDHCDKKLRGLLDHRFQTRFMDSMQKYMHC